jgi:hypothetical protein
VPQPPRSALGYGALGRLRLSLAVTTYRAAARSVASHPVSVERPHRARRERTLRVPRAQRQYSAFGWGSGESLLVPALGIRPAAERVRFAIAVARVKLPGFDEIGPRVQPEPGHPVLAGVIFQAVKEP